MITKTLAACLLVFLTAFSHETLAQSDSTSPDRVWQALDANNTSLDLNQLTSLSSIPRAFQPFKLDRGRLTGILRSSRPQLNSTNQCKGVILSLPKPTADHVWLRFCITESPMMEPDLAAQFPEIKTYEGQGVDDRSMTARLDWTPAGFHAMVLSSGDTFFIDPLPRRRGDLSTYMGYFDKDSAPKPFHCSVESNPEGQSRPAGETGSPVTLSNGAVLRTYRLAVATTGEYTKFHGGIDKAFAGVVTTVNRVNAIYNHELAIHLILVKDQRKIIYDNPITDPYSNESAHRLLNENQVNLDKEIGTANYDIGHVFGTGGGGLAAVGVVGVEGRKAKGETGSQSPKGDPFDVDYVAHEIGHQFGANHTFNGTTGNCGGNNRNSDTAFEPGSGSTIMAYAGICGDENLQLLTDPFFHFASLYEIISFVGRDDVKAVPAISNTLNSPPIVRSDSSFQIPKQTPFALTASAVDADGDKLSFSWEELDLGLKSPPNHDEQDVRPIFRSYRPEGNTTRVFPKPEYLLSGAATLGESLPTKNRIMNFRVTVRDNRVGGGGFGSSPTQVMVVTDSGPFTITQPVNTAVWHAGSTQPISWDVAGTSSPPINCLNVRILISTDGGITFTVLKESTPNNGFATVVVPNTPTAKARIKIEAISNVFFNISKGDFRISSN